MNPLWVLKGSWDAPGWADLRKDSEKDAVDLVIFDRDRWALIRAEKPPTKYDGLTPTKPADGMYVSEDGYPIYVVAREEKAGPMDVIEALGDAGKAMLEKTKDADLAIERLGRAF